MGFDWWTVCAQVVNLFVLLWFLKKFLYHPIINAVDKRQADIAKRIEDSKKQQKAAEKQYQDYLRKQEEFAKEKKSLYDKAQEQVEQYKTKQQQLIKEQFHAKKEHLQLLLDRELVALQVDLRNMIVNSFADFSRKVCYDLLEEAPQTRLVSLLEKQLLKLTQKQKNDILKNIKNQSVVTVFSSEDLSEDLQVKVKKSFLNMLGIKKADFMFKQQPELGLGFEICVADILIEWNLKLYLEQFDADLNTALKGLILKTGE